MRSRVVLILMSFTGVSFAHIKDGVWQVHRAAYPPVIDGEMDPV